MNRLNWTKNEGLEFPFNSSCGTIANKRKKSNLLFLAVVVVMKGEKVKVEIGSQEPNLFVKILSAPS